MKIIYHHRTQAKGAEGVHINETVNALEDLGHSVSVVSLLKGNVSTDKTSDDVQQKVRKDGFSTVILKFISKNIPEFAFEMLEMLYNVFSFIYLCYNILKFKPDFIYERYSLFMISGVLASKVFGIPIIIEVNDSAIVQRVRPLHFKGVAKRFERFIFKYCSGLVFISNEFLQTVLSNYDDVSDTIILPNAANIKTFNSELFDSSDLVARYDLKGKVVCGYVGAFVEWHGIHTFVKEIASELKSNPELILLLVGDGVCYEEIDCFVKDQNLEKSVILTGRVNHESVPELINVMDFSILPNSNMYGSPMKIFEFMSMSVPVISPDYPPIVEVIDDGKTGWIFEKNNYAQAVRKTIDVFNNNEERKKVGSSALHYINSSRTWGHNAEDIIQLYEGVK